VFLEVLFGVVEGWDCGVVSGVGGCTRGTKMWSHNWSGLRITLGMNAKQMLARTPSAPESHRISS